MISARVLGGSPFHAPTRRMEATPAATTDAWAAEEGPRAFTHVQVVQALWRGTALPHEAGAAHLDTGERVALEPVREVQYFLEKVLDEWIGPLRAEMSTHLAGQPARVRADYEARFREVVTHALHRPLAAATDLGTEKWHSFDERVSLTLLTLRSFLANHRHAFDYLDRLLLASTSEEAYEQAWNDAINDNILLRMNHCFGLTNFPLHVYERDLARRGLRVEQGVCQPAEEFSALEKEASERAYEQGKRCREEQLQSAAEVAGKLTALTEARTLLKHLYERHGNIPNILHWRTYVQDSAQREKDVQQRILAHEAQLTDDRNKESISLIQAALDALADEYEGCRATREAYRQIGSLLKQLQQIGLPVPPDDTSLQDVFTLLTRHLTWQPEQRKFVLSPNPA